MTNLRAEISFSFCSMRNEREQSLDRVVSRRSQAESYSLSKEHDVRVDKQFI